MTTADITPLVSDDDLMGRTRPKGIHEGSGERYARLMSAPEVRDIYEKDRAEKDKLISELREGLEMLSKQVTLCEFRDEHGHLLEMNAAYLDVQALLSTLPKPQL